MDTLSNNGNAPEAEPQSRIPWWFVHCACALLAAPFLVSPHPVLKWSAMFCFAVNMIEMVREI